MPSGRLQQLANAEDRFLGGPADMFEPIGRLQLITLLRLGLEADSNVLDVGCGALRGGYWLIQFLDKSCYFGLEPNESMLRWGLSEVVGATLSDAKAPRFSGTSDFDASEFGVRFDFWVARSVWTHASIHQIDAMLSSFAATAKDDAVFLTSYLPASRDSGYEGTGWIGRSHESNEPGLVRYEPAQLTDVCAKYGLGIWRLQEDNLSQQWLVVEKGNGLAPVRSYLAPLATLADVDHAPAESFTKATLTARVRALASRLLRRSGG